MKKNEVIRLSYSALSRFLDCRRKYYWEFVKKLEPLAFRTYGVVGNAIHYGVNRIYEKDDKAISSAIKFFNSEKNNMRKKLDLSPDQEQELNDQEFMIRGMLKAYSFKYAEEIKSTNYICNEFKAEYLLSDKLLLVIKIDNVLERRGRRFVHELKTVRILTPEYVKNIKNDLQTGIYFHVYNSMQKKSKDKFRGIIYDVIKKPSIRLKMGESKSEFIERLYQYYLGSDSNELFHQDIIERPMLSENRIMNVISRVADDIRRCEDIEDFYPNDRFCYVKKKCDYYDICHYGENPETRRKYRPKYQRELDNKEEVGGVD